MGRPYSDKLIQFVTDRKVAGTHSLGTRLAELSIEANLPAAYIAAMLNTSRMSVYSWFRDKTQIRKRNASEVQTLIAKIEQDLMSGILPAKNMEAAAAYASYRPSNVVPEPEPQMPLNFITEDAISEQSNVNAA